MDGDGAKKKRGTERQLTKDNYKDDEVANADEGVGDFARASEAALKTRNIRRVRRGPAAAVTTTGTNPFAGISLTTAAPTASSEPEAEPTVAEASTEAEKKSETEAEEEVNNADQGQSSAGDTPAVATPAVATPPSAKPDVRFQSIEIKSGEEDEETVFSEKATLFSSTESKWSSHGTGDVKINLDSNGKARLIMRHDVTLQLLLNARLYPQMKPLTMATDAVTFSCQNYLDKPEEEKLEYRIFAVRFKSEAQQKVQRFMEALEKHKLKAKPDGAAD